MPPYVAFEELASGGLPPNHTLPNGRFWDSMGFHGSQRIWKGK